MFGRKTVYTGSMGVPASDLAAWRAFADMRGEPANLPGGVDANIYVRDALKQGTKDAAEFRKRISLEMDEMKKAGLKPDEKKAKNTVRNKFKKFRKWK